LSRIEQRYNRISRHRQDDDKLKFHISGHESQIFNIEQGLSTSISDRQQQISVAEELSGDPLGRMPVTIQLEEFVTCQNDILDENHEDKIREHL